MLPRVEPLGGGHPRGDGVGAEGAIPHMVALHGEDDVAIRTYRDGDDLRRIHWPATAHRGELMVRQEDRPGPPARGPGAGLPLQRPPGLGRLRLVRVGRDRGAPRWPCT